MFGYLPHIATTNVRLAIHAVADVWFLRKVRLATVKESIRHNFLPQTCGELLLRPRHKLLCHGNCGHPAIPALAAREGAMVARRRIAAVPRTAEVTSRAVAEGRR
jgi:hypothetical protein